jgi:hypothetical protein
LIARPRDPAIALAQLKWAWMHQLKKKLEWGTFFVFVLLYDECPGWWPNNFSP